MKNAKILINGKHKLGGSVRISGAKNAGLPELAAVLLSDGEFHFESVPRVEDIKVMFQALENLGAEGIFEANTVKISVPKLKSMVVPKEIVATSRASVLMLGPLVARNGCAKVSRPGGCPIGDRKIDFHLQGLQEMGVTIQETPDHIIAYTADGLKGIDFTFPTKTVTGTENLLMAAVLAQGKTVLRNCALEPEVADLINLLIAMGADIKGINTDTLEVSGKSHLNGARHTLIPDRIEMGTYVIAAALKGNNNVIIENAIPEYIASLLDVLTQIGIEVNVKDNQITLGNDGLMRPIELETLPYPGYPTDLQAQLTTLLTQVEGVSRIKENIFNNRFQHAMELNKLGAQIEVNKDLAVIKGKTPFNGQCIRATDLRASAALVLAGLIGEGQTIVENAYQLLRGYEDMPQKLRQLGADITLINE
ncbi:MAG: UDP-N-acetylglucosamine 1-carboxyvinyltransferase [Acidobacteria bacterium]|jgi:UDP-N-acetylglucosamine 1-carboxyvinyltransferase|nr:UDP-N-acetylglucosamine 1-carboxyvinyltransferase [Acidobacteriota bacterium]